MATYDKIQRRVLIRANQLKSNTASTLATNYTTADIDGTEMGDRAVEFTFEAVNDAILDAGDKLVSAIGENKDSPYRSHFAGVTDIIASGGTIGTEDATSKPIVGVIGRVFDTVSGREMEFKPMQMVRSANTITLKNTNYYYFTDNVRIWHTAGNVYADCVIWSKDDQTTLLTSTPTRGVCPFPEGLHEALVCGALSYIFRENFNIETVGIWKNYFDQIISRLEQGKMVEEKE